jgi:hypothetical protein
MAEEDLMNYDREEDLMNYDRYDGQINLNRYIPRILVLSSFVAIHALILYCSSSAFSQNISPEHRETLEKLLSSYSNIPPYSMQYSSDTKVLDKEGVTIKKRAALYRQEGIIRKSDKQMEVIYTAYKPEEKLNELYQGEKLVPSVAGHTYWDRGENRKLSYTDSTPGTPEDKYAIVWPDLKLSLGISPDATGWFADGVIVDSQHFSETLLNSNDLTVKTEKKTSGESVLHFEGSTPFGRLEVWVSDETQPQLQRASFVASAEFLKEAEMNRMDFDITILERTEIDGISIVTKARRLNTFEHSDGTAYRVEQILNRSEIEFNPDFEKAGAFDFDLPNGTIVYPYAGGPIDGIEYLWQDGRIVVNVDEVIVEQIDKMTEEILAEGAVPDGLKVDQIKQDTPNGPTIVEEAQPERQVDTAKGRGEVLSETSPFYTLLLIPIGMLIIGIISWKVYIIKGRKN